MNSAHTIQQQQMFCAFNLYITLYSEICLSPITSGVSLYIWDRQVILDIEANCFGWFIYYSVYKWFDFEMCHCI